jgi:hypothetical protein
MGNGPTPNIGKTLVTRREARRIASTGMSLPNRTPIGAKAALALSVGNVVVSLGWHDTEQRRVLMAAEWTYDPIAHVFRNAVGKTLTAKQMVTIRDAFILSREEHVKAIVAQWDVGEITREVMINLFRQATAETITALSVIGAGGQQRAGQIADFERILSDALGKQMPFADRFVQEILSGALSADDIAARAAQYQSSAVETYEQASASDWGIDLPYWPADHLTTCFSNCRCAWLIDTVFEGDDQVTFATWATEGDDKVCEDCAARGQEWQHREVSRMPRTDPGPHGLEQAA